MLRDTRAASVAGAGAGDAWLDYRVDDPAELLYLLKQLRDAGEPVSLSAPHGRVLSCRLSSLDETHGHMNFSVDAGAVQLQQLALGDEAAAVAYLDSVKLQFDLAELLLVHGDSGCVLRSRLPRELYRFQRRASYRVRTAERPAPSARLRHPSIPDMQLRLRIVDVSAGGCALALPDDVPNLQPGSCLHGVRIEIDADTVFAATLRLQHASSLHADGAGLRLGCEWQSLDAAAQRALQRYIDRAQRRRHLLAPR